MRVPAYPYQVRSGCRSMQQALHPRHLRPLQFRFRRVISRPCRYSRSTRASMPRKVPAAKNQQHHDQRRFPLVITGSQLRLTSSVF